MLTRGQILSSLQAAGVQRGDHLLIHSSLRAVGPIDGGADAMIDAMLQAVGISEGGTLAMPAFNYTRPPPMPHFDPHLTPGATGVLSERFRLRDGTQRSLHPAHSVCAAGRRAEEFLADHHLHGSFGVDSPIDRIAQAGGWVLLVGVSHTSSSTIHVGESHAGVKKFWWHDDGPGVVKVKCPKDGKIVDVPLDCSSSCSMAFNLVEFTMRQRNAIRDVGLGNALCYLMRGKDVIDAVVQMIRRQGDVLFCNRATCRPCRLGREQVSASEATR